MTSLRFVVALLAALAAVACGEGGTAPITPITTAYIAVSPSSVMLSVGETQQLTATPRDANGGTLVGRNIVWSSQNSAVASVTGGLVTAISRGTTSVVAASDGKEGVVAIAVLSDIAVIRVLPSVSTVSVGMSLQLTASPLNRVGIPLSSRSIVWGSSNQLVATVTQNGLVTVMSSGPADITATSEGVSGSASIIGGPVSVASVAVTPVAVSLSVGSSAQLTAATLDANGNTLSGRVITWLASDASRASVSASGLVTAVAAGVTAISATSEGKSGVATVTVTSIPVATVTLSPGTASVTVGSSQQFTATTLAAGFAVLTGRTITWGTSDATRATVSTSGLVTGVAVGSAVISATSEGKTASAAVTVTSPISTVRFTNHLIADIRVYTSAATLGTVNAQSSSSFATGGLTTVSYSVLPLLYSDGTAIPNDFSGAYFENVTNGSSLLIDNVVGVKTYFAPRITNTGSTTIAVEIRNSFGNRCIATLNGQYQFPYYLFDTSAEIRAYVGSSCSGSPRIWSNSVISGLIELNSGRTALSYP